MIPIDFDSLEQPDDGGQFYLLNGRSFTGIAYERDPATGVIVDIYGFERGYLSGCCRTWSPSGTLLEEDFYRLGGLHGPVRAWHPDGTLKSNRYFPQGSEATPERIAWAVVDIDLDAMEFVEHPWGWGKEPLPPPSFDEFRGFKRSEGDTHSYVIEQPHNGREVVHVESMQLQGQSLLVDFKRRSLRFDDAFAARLIQDKILRDVCMEAYRGRAKQVAFRSVPTGLVEVVPYSSS